MQEQIDLHTTQLARITKKTTKDLLQGGSTFSCYRFYMFLQKLYLTPSSGKGELPKKLIRSETSEATLTPLPPATGLSKSYIKVSYLYTYRTISTEIKHIIACLKNYNAHIPTVFP